MTRASRPIRRSSVLLGGFGIAAASSSEVRQVRHGKSLCALVMFTLELHSVSQPNEVRLRHFTTSREENRSQRFHPLKNTWSVYLFFFVMANGEQ